MKIYAKLPPFHNVETDKLYIVLFRVTYFQSFIFKNTRKSYFGTLFGRDAVKLPMMKPFLFQVVVKTQQRFLNKLLICIMLYAHNENNNNKHHARTISMLAATSKLTGFIDRIA
jgi:hypothetical protein